jgi:hypothetical protein
MPFDAAAGGAFVRQHENSTRIRSHPASLVRQVTAEATLSVEADERCLDVGNDRFDLDDDQTTRRRVEPKNVDRPTLTTDIERDLGDGLPPVAIEQRDRSLDKVGVASVEQSIEALSLPEEPDIETRPERGRDRFQRVDRNAIGSCSLDAVDDRT